MDRMDIQKRINVALSVLMNAKSDNEHLAALFSVTKLLKAHDLDLQEQQKIYDAIGFKFVNRLLRTNGASSDCSAYAYKSIALTVLSCFCRVKSMVRHPSMLVNVGEFNKIISTPSSTKENEDVSDELKVMVSDAYEILLSIARIEDGLNALMLHGTIDVLCSIIAERSYGWKQGAKILGLITHGEKIEEEQKKVATVLEMLARDFHDFKDEDKFMMCGVLLDVLEVAKKDYLQILDFKLFWEKILDGLFLILQNKLGSDQRNPAIKLASCILKCFGINWLIRRGEKYDKFYFLLLHLSSIEVRMLLDDHTENQIVEKIDVLVSCYSVIELSIFHASSDDVDPDKAKQLLEVVFDGMSSVVAYLASCMDMEDGHKQISSPVVLASLRLFGAYISFQDYALDEDVLAILPFIVDVCKVSCSAYCQHSRDADKINEDGANGCAMDETTTEENTRERSSDLERPESHIQCPDLPPVPSLTRYESIWSDFISVDVIPVLLSGLEHLSYVDEARRLFVEKDFDSQLVEYLEKRWKRCRSDQTILWKLCRILINLLHFKNIPRSRSGYIRLLRFLVLNLSETSSPFLFEEPCIVLHGHLSVLGLLTLNNICSEPASNCDELKSFVDFVTSFLQQVHRNPSNVDEIGFSKFSRPMSDLVDELYIACVEVLSESMLVVPGISTIFANSGYLSSTVSRLLTARDSQSEIPESLAAAIGKLLTSLFESGQRLESISDKENVIELIRIFKMVELSKHLNACNLIDS